MHFRGTNGWITGTPTSNQPMSTGFPVEICFEAAWVERVQSVFRISKKMKNALHNFLDALKA
jgi:hypothetical protein